MTHVSQPHEREQLSRKSRNRKIVIGFFIFLGVVIVLESPLTRVQSFTVSGNRSIAKSQLLSDTTLKPGMSLWQVDGGQIQSQIKAHEPLVDKVTVHTSFLKRVVNLQIVEKKVVALYEDSGKFYTLLSDGMIYTSVASTQGFYYPIVTFSGGSEDASATSTPSAVSAIPHVGQAVSPEIQTLCQQMAAGGDNASNDVSQIRVTSDGTAIVYLDNGFIALCSVNDYRVALPNIRDAVQYFLNRGYAPGMIDMTSAPPYRYTPFSKAASSQKTGG